MTDRLLRPWSWVARHHLLTGWLVAALGAVVFLSGIVLGAARAEPVPFRDSTATTLARPRTSVVEAVITGRRPAGFVARTRAGDLLLVRTTDATTYRRGGRPAQATNVRRGTRVLIIGRPGAREGVVVARAVAILGQLRSPTPAAGEPDQPG
jgi:hypothetical protein